MSRLTRDGTAEPVSRDQILRREREQGNVYFPVQLTTSRIGNLTRLIRDLAICVTIHIYCRGPQTIGRFGTNTSGDDCTPRRAGKDTKSSGRPCLSTANTFTPCGLAISSCGLTSTSAIITATALDKSCKWPKWRHFIEADIQPHFI